MFEPDRSTALGRALSRRRAQRRKYHITQSIARPGLMPWQKALALWIARQPRPPKKREMLAQANWITKTRLSPHHLTMLLAREDFQALVGAYSESEEVKTKALIQSQMPEAIDIHFEALKALHATKQYGDVAKFTAPYFDRAYPTKAPAAPTQQAVVIHLGTGPFAAQHLDAEEPEIVVEPIQQPTDESA